MTREDIKAKFGEAALIEYDRRKAEGETDEMIVSALIGYVSNSALLGMFLGGDIAGGLLGDLLNDDDINLSD